MHECSHCFLCMLQSSSNEHASNSVVAVKLATDESTGQSGIEGVNFVCTLSELQDFVSKLKEALRQIEHVAQITSS